MSRPLCQGTDWESVAVLAEPTTIAALRQLLATEYPDLMQR